MPVVLRFLLWLIVIAMGCGGPVPASRSTAQPAATVPLLPPTASSAVSDRDGDGAEDGQDQCPDAPEDCDGFQDEDGCPDPDNDGDGIPDICDRCPDELETFNGRDDQDGCPDHIVIIQSSIRIEQRVMFPYGSATPLAASRAVIEALAGVMKDHPEIERVGLVGHAAPGEPDPVRLGERRAKAVRTSLERLGVSPSLLEVRSLGAKHPLVAPSDTGQEKNRRVEFALVRARGEDVMRWEADGYTLVYPPPPPAPAAPTVPCPDPNAPVPKAPPIACAGKKQGSPR